MRRSYALALVVGFMSVSAPAQADPADTALWKHAHTLTLSFHRSGEAPLSYGEVLFLGEAEPVAGTHQNPLYQDKNMQGQNPLYEGSKFLGGLISAPALSDIQSVRLDVVSMSAIHNEGIVHRDIAARVSLSTDVGEFRLADVDADVVVSSDRAADGVGPIRWMSPESIQKRLYLGGDPASEGAGYFMLDRYQLLGTPVPEPSALVLLALGAGVVIRSRRA